MAQRNVVLFRNAKCVEKLKRIGRKYDKNETHWQNSK